MLTIDTQTHEPIYVQLEKQIIKLIQLGVYTSNCPLPSVRAMACKLGINPNTVARAYKELEAQNVIYTIGGKGVFVSEGNDSYIKRLALDELKKAVINARGCGIELNEVQELINSEWRAQND